MQPTSFAPTAENLSEGHIYGSGYQSSSERSRRFGLTLAIVAHLLVLIVMLSIAPTVLKKKEEKAPTTFTLNPVPNPAPTPGPVTPKVDKARETDTGSPPKAPPVPPKPPTPPVTPKPLELPQLIGGKDMFDAVGVATTKPGREGDGDGQSVAGKDSGSAYGPGSGPGGERLYNAEWYREPSSAELNGYMPARAQPGWGLIACKTIENYHVENCRALDESPLGSGLARAFRQAAWQFRVRPPRIGGKDQIGAWVSIRITIMESGQVTAR